MGGAVLLLGGLGPLGVMDSAGGVRGCGRSRGIWGWLWFLRGIVLCGGGFAAIFQKFFASIKEFFIFAGARGTGLGSRSMGSGHSPKVS